MSEATPIETSHFEGPSSLELLRSGEKLNRLETIPLDNVLVDTALLDPQHARDLQASMETENQGLLVPILVRAREDNGSVVYDVADGFHRTSAKKQLGDPTIDAKVLYGCSNEELADHRILAANSVKSVRFGRLAIWMNDAYSLTPWAKAGIGMSEAFSIAVFNSPQDRNGRLTEKQTEGLKNWARNKANHWQMSIHNVWTNLGIIEQSDPDLVRIVRPRLAKQDEGKAITQTHLRAVSEPYPSPGNYGLQRAIIQWTLSTKASVQQTDTLATKLLDRVSLGMSQSSAERVIKAVLKEEAETQRAREEIAQRRRDRAEFAESNPKPHGKRELKESEPEMVADEQPADQEPVEPEHSNPLSAFEWWNSLESIT